MLPCALMFVLVSVLTYVLTFVLTFVPAAPRSLMARAGIPDISDDPAKMLLKLEAKFQLDLDDEAAVQHFQALINESASALFEQIKESAHRIAQYWRR